MSTQAKTYKPEPGSLADRVLQLFRKQPREEYSAADFASMFNVTSAQQAGAMITPINLQLVSYEVLPGDTRRTWRAGARFAEWAANVDAGGAAAAPAPAAQAKPAGTRAPAARLQLDTVVIKTGAPIPPAPRPGLRPVYQELWARMKPGDCVELADRHAQGLAQYCKKAGEPHVNRRLGPGVIGVWRLPAEAKAPASTAPAKSAANDPKASKKAAKA